MERHRLLQSKEELNSGLRFHIDLTQRRRGRGRDFPRRFHAFPRKNGLRSGEMVV